jgi:transcription initiation factor TFIIIB Brf1 subunit/transcription initiation factor TFIIB
MSVTRPRWAASATCINSFESGDRAVTLRRRFNEYALQELYRMYAQTREKVSDVKSTAAAAVFIATKECKCGRTIKEINKVVDPTRNMKNAMGKASRELTKVMQERLQVRFPHCDSDALVP